MYVFTDRHGGCRIDHKKSEGHIHLPQRSYCGVHDLSPWSKSVIPFPSLRQKIQAYKDDNKQVTTTWDNGIMPQFSALQKPSQNFRKLASGKTRNRWSRCNHQFNLIKTNRYNALGMNLMDMNKIDIVQPAPKRACECFGATCSYSKCEAPHPSPIQSDWSSEDWDGEKAKAREQKSLIDFNPPKPDSKQTMNLETADDLPIQNLSIHEGQKEEELPEVRDALVPPPKASAATPSDRGDKTGEHCGRKQWRIDRHRMEVIERRRRVCYICWDAE